MTDDTRRRILIDGGQTGTRVRVESADGVDEFEAAPIRTDRPVVDQIAATVRGIPVDDPGATLAAGVSGLTPSASRPGEILDELADVGIVSVALAHDSVTGYLSANGGEFGAVTAVGTGVVTLGVGAGGVHRVDGWGHLFGDAGSAYWMGRAGIEAALRAFDGRGPDTVLEEAAAEEFGPLPELYMELQGDPDRVSRVAAFARRVDAASTADDPVAQQILTDAADELAASVAAALERSGHRPGDAARVSWVGTVMTANDRLRERFAAAVIGRTSGVEIAEPHGRPFDGVRMLAGLDDEHPLATQIHRAGR
ncbi:BadF/BadG/BcrA/BcrD ATPase family protein [Gordonia sp. 'Campus']|uniref:N-acetylglucosamine kinase n=1 Tax=Gordonia sp. 'Campus' TaxID=2915824 RepID=UPI001EE3F95F|nr:BadF/BadG/BcrA/BcrD ATPase family protein [Gordonia sp. 'Campus']